MLFLLMEKAYSSHFLLYQNVRPRPVTIEELKTCPAEISCSIPVTPDTMFSLAPFLLLLAHDLGCLPSSTRLFPFQHPLLHALPLHFTKRCQVLWEMNKSGQRTLGWETGLCPWHWGFPQDFGRICHWAVIHWTFVLAAVPAEVAFTILLLHHTLLPPLPISSPGPPPQSHWYNVWPRRKLLQRRDQHSA